MVDKYQLAQVFSPDKGPEWRLRQGYVVSVGGGSATVTVAGSSTNVSGVKYMGAAPTASAGCWLMVCETDMFILGQTS